MGFFTKQAVPTYPAGETAFSQLKHNFDEVEIGSAPDRKVNTAQLIEAVESFAKLLTIMDNKGLGFGYKDLTANLEKVRKPFLADPVGNATIQDLVNNDKKPGDESASGGVFWLIQALTFLAEGFNRAIYGRPAKPKEHNNNTDEVAELERKYNAAATPEDKAKYKTAEGKWFKPASEFTFARALQDAHIDATGRYIGYLGQKAVSTGLGFAPSKEDFFTYLGDPALVEKHAQEWLVGLTKVDDVLFKYVETDVAAKLGKKPPRESWILLKDRE